MPELCSIIIPAYNEGDRIGRTLEQVFAFFAEQQLNTEIIVIDDGSRDNTTEVVNEFEAQHPNLRVLHNPGNRGKGYSVRNGMLNARGDVLLFTDADLSSPIEEAPKLFEALANGAEVAFGSRWVETELQVQPQPILRQIAGRVYNILLRVILGLHYKDTQCGFKAFNRRAAEVVFTRQHIERWGFDPELLFIARKFGLRLVEVPVKWAHDDRSKINPLLDGIKMFGEMLSIRWWWLTGRYRQPAFEFAPAEPGTVLNAQRR